MTEDEVVAMVGSERDDDDEDEVVAVVGREQDDDGDEVVAVAGERAGW